MFKWLSSLKNAVTGMFSVSDSYRLRIYEQKIICYNRLLMAARKHYTAQLMHHVVKTIPGGDTTQPFIDMCDAYLDSMIYSSERVVDELKKFMAFKSETITQGEGGTDFRLAYFALANAMREDLSVEKFHDLTKLLSDLPAPLRRGKQ